MHLSEVVRQELHEILEGRIGKIRIPLERMNLQIFVHSFYIFDILEGHSHDSCAGLQIDKILVCRILGLLYEVPLLQDVVGSPAEIFFIIWLEKIIHSIDLIAIHSILGISG